MVLTSYEFIAFFIVVFALYYLLPKSWQWVVLLLSSFAFYAISGLGFLPYLLSTIITTYIFARLIENNQIKASEYVKLHKEDISKEERKAYSDKKKGQRKGLVALCVLINVGVLAFVKYSNFFIENINGFLSGESKLSFLTIALPLGISFYTLTSIGYLTDVYRGVVPAEKNIFKFGLFISFFPLLIQGPISRFKDLSETLFSTHKYDSQNVSYGLERVLWGFFKKLVIADRLLNAVTNLLSGKEPFTGGYVVAGMIFYTIELYADFTGGIDITIGISQMLGIKVAENFERPYFSKSLKEYWRRWHITMASWFREYVFYPVSTSKPMQMLSKGTRKLFGNGIGRKIPVYLSSFIVWFSTGIWHGANWNFIVWGLLNWAILMISEELEPATDKFHEKCAWSNTKGYKVFMMARTFALICVLNLFDCFAKVSDTFKAFGSMITGGNHGVMFTAKILDCGLSVSDFIVVLASTAIMLAVSLIQRSGSVRAKIAAKSSPVKYVIRLGLFLAVLIFGAYGVGYDSSQFIYNRF